MGKNIAEVCKNIVEMGKNRIVEVSKNRVKTKDSGECVGKKPFSLPTSRRPQRLQLDC